MDLDDDELRATRKAKGLEKTADEMFKQLGYKKIEVTKEEEDYLISAVYKKDTGNKDELRLIEFWNNETVGKYDNWCRYDCLTMQELQAIYKKSKELGWI